MAALYPAMAHEVSEANSGTEIENFLTRTRDAQTRGAGGQRPLTGENEVSEANSDERFEKIAGAYPAMGAAH